jgi:hypothetical protein
VAPSGGRYASAPSGTHAVMTSATGWLCEAHAIVTRDIYRDGTPKIGLSRPFVDEKSSGNRAFSLMCGPNRQDVRRSDAHLDIQWHNVD